MHITRPPAQVVDAEGDISALGRLADQRDAQRPEIFREDRDDIDAQCTTSS